jgi:hypothetical protein
LNLLKHGAGSKCESCEKREIMKQNTKVVLVAGAAFLTLIAIIAAMMMVISPFFNIANVVSGGR